MLRFTGPIFFGVASEMLEALRRAGQRPRAIILRMEQVPYIDATGANALATFTRQAPTRGHGNLAGRAAGAAARVPWPLRTAFRRSAARVNLGGGAVGGCAPRPDYFGAVTLTAAVLTAATALPRAVTGSRGSWPNNAVQATSTSWRGCAALSGSGVQADGLPAVSTK